MGFDIAIKVIVDGIGFLKKLPGEFSGQGETQIDARDKVPSGSDKKVHERVGVAYHQIAPRRYTHVPKREGCFFGLSLGLLEDCRNFRV
ncbi:MAG: hypothetical protein NT154_47630, partial [Verrucomicrobia bacterium]|nr:hypothetical protein [Verrucomicrobiota bacterium]